MPRQAREIEVGVPMHITQRGNERKNIFRCDEEKKPGDSHQLKKDIKPLFLLSVGGVLPMLKMVFSA